MDSTIMGCQSPVDSPGPIFIRETRSGKYFATWDKPYVRAAAPDFDLESLLKASLAREAIASTDTDLDLFSLSPLSSPDSTPQHSRPPSVASTPTQSPRLAPSPLPIEESTPSSQPAAKRLAKESSARKAKKKKHSHANRDRRRQKERAQGFAVVETREDVINKYVKGNVPIELVLGSPVSRLQKDRDWTGPEPEKTGKLMDRKRPRPRSGPRSNRFEKIDRPIKNRSGPVSTGL
ncbi:hypothetical protein BJ912DRAFT_1054303 [Pholiota molesta]|nr:hypothetical protein BJ912DRAFT_1054303 [Pholiota molesta]